MKRCTVCAEYWPDSNSFCGNCGGALVDAGFVENVDEKTVAATEYKVHTTAPTGVVDNSVDYGVVSNETIEQQPVKKSKKPLLAVVCAVLVVAVIFSAGLLTNWFGLGSPLNGLIRAAAKTMKSESMTIDVKMRGASADEAMTVRYAGDIKNEELSYIIEEDNYKGCLYDGYMYREYSDGDMYRSEVDYDEIFENIERYYDGKKIDWEEVIVDADLEDYINHEEVDGFLKDIYKDCLSDKKWLKNYLGFKKSGNVYTFEPDLEKLFEEINDICQDSDVFTKDAKDDLEEEFEYLIDAAKEEDAEISIEITVKGGRINNVEVNADSDNEKIRLTAELYDFNKTDIAEDAQEIVDDYKDYADEHGCDECGDIVYEYSEHGDCEECDYHGDLYAYDLCEDCYEDEYYDYCDNCNAYEDLYYWDGEDLCWDCYDAEVYDDYDYCDDCGEYAEMYYWDGEDLCWDCYLDA